VENVPEQIEYALAGGFDAKVDLWRIAGDWFVGSEKPAYPVSEKFIRQKGLWLHCRNFAALDVMVSNNQKSNYFWHEADSYSLTSRGYIWAYPSQAVSESAICVMPEWEDSSFSNIGDLNCLGICSDYILNVSDIVHDR
jgi:hypothetical protein